MLIGCGMDLWCYQVVVAVLCLRYVLPQDACKFGTGCLFPCRCADGSCDPDTGTCTSGCERGAPQQYPWQGPACQIGNVAYHKDAWQKGLVKPEWGASRAVDGAINRYYCAHPSQAGQGWWMVDLGQLHRVERIYYSNTVQSSWVFAQDLQFFISNRSVVADSLLTDFTGFSLCGQRTIQRSEDAEIECTSPLVGRYVIVYKNSTSSPAGSFLACEVAVIGNVYIPCSDCTSECNDVFGCIDDCPSGKNQTTFCADDCYGAYGFHCETPCSGHCRDDPVSCDPVDGTCPRGCETWWTEDKCDVHIAKLEFDSFQGVIDIPHSASDSLTASWHSAQGIPQDLASHYGYQVTCVPDSLSGVPFRRDEQDIPHTSAQNATATLHNLTHNTVYHVRVTPYRRHLGTTELAKFAHLIITRTGCIAPGRPSVVNVVAFDTSDPVQSVNVSWTVPTNTGCNVIRDEEVQYSHGKAWMTEGGLHAAILHYHVFAPKRPGFYAVRVRVTNDQGLATISDVHTINVDGEFPEYPDGDYNVAKSSEENSANSKPHHNGTMWSLFIITCMLSYWS